ncbi:MAG TPA: thioredoxin domain-containing protein [Candidatus Limnocylindrales bacterium]|nr:thioredoxin domain-containing protein [Candidatus Limnocylindrales bacterium]
MPDPVPATNRLARETSPYLLQHAHDPVDWYAWGPEAFERAQLADRPIFLSVGYAACHWCHVMEHESFQDEGTAADLNAGFVAIKVDREERPDVDAIYMGAVQAMTGQGGWPMSVFLTPDGRPFFGGTYFPRDARGGLPAFREVLAGVATTWQLRRAEVEDAASRLAQALAAQNTSAAAGVDRPGAGPLEAVAESGGLVGLDGRPLVAHHPVRPPVDRALLEQALEGIERDFDEATGGWGRAPKFPQPQTIEFLLHQAGQGGHELAAAMARRTLEAMADGGINDQLGGGFARYATDADWLVPHFEKMLYDNAQLARAYLHAWQAGGPARFREVVQETLDWLLREMTTPEGGFAASLDADTAGQEGGTYVWTAAEIRSVLGEAAYPAFAVAFGVTETGNWEGRTILHRAHPEAAAGLGGERHRLLEARAKRPQPARDDKVVSGWNGLAISALAEAGLALHRPDYLAAARAAADLVLERSIDPQGRLHRTWKDGRAGPLGVLEDHAALAEGLLALYEATFEERWFVAARQLLDRIIEHFTDPGGGWFDTADDSDRLPIRPKGLQDGAVPSGNALAATVLQRLAALTGEARYAEPAEGALGLVAGLVGRFPTAFARWLTAIDLAVHGIQEVAVVGRPDEASSAALLEVARRGFRPWIVLACAAPGAAAASAVPLLHERGQVGGVATAYVCRGFACQAPVTAPAALAEQLEG